MFDKCSLQTNSVIHTNVCKRIPKGKLQDSRCYILHSFYISSQSFGPFLHDKQIHWWDTVAIKIWYASDNTWYSRFNILSPNPLSSFLISCMDFHNFSKVLQNVSLILFSQFNNSVTSNPKLLFPQIVPLSSTNVKSHLYRITPFIIRIKCPNYDLSPKLGHGVKGLCASITEGGDISGDYLCQITGVLFSSLCSHLRFWLSGLCQPWIIKRSIL